VGSHELRDVMVCLVDMVLIEVIRMQGFFELCGFELLRGIFR